jgi:putative oxidoreductase
MKQLRGIAMTIQTTGSTHPALSHTDDIAARTTDILLLIGRILIGWLFFKSGWDKLMNMPGFESYLSNLKVPNPGFWSWPAVAAELLIGAALILGIATRYAALIAFVYLIIATALAHRYWDYPAAQQSAQFAHFLKNLAIMGGALILFATGGGRFSLDRSISTRV